MKQLFACMLLLLLAAPTLASVKGDTPLGNLTIINFVQRLGDQMAVNGRWKNIELKEQRAEDRLARIYNLAPQAGASTAFDVTTQQLVSLTFLVGYETSTSKNIALPQYYADIWESIQIAAGLFVSPQDREKIKKNMAKIMKHLGPDNENIFKRPQKLNIKKAGITLSARILDNALYVLSVTPYKK